MNKLIISLVPGVCLMFTLNLPAKVSAEDIPGNAGRGFSGFGADAGAVSADTLRPAGFVRVPGGGGLPSGRSVRKAPILSGSDNGMFDGFGLQIEDATVESGAGFCVPVTVRAFQDILGMQFSIRYNQAHLQFDSVANFGLNGLTAGSTGHPSPGVITLVWDDPSVSGQTLSDGAVLLDLCFKALAPNGTTTSITIADSPTPIEFIQKVGDDEKIITYETGAGSITIAEVSLVINPAGTGPGHTVITDVDCFGASTGAIALSVEGGSGAYTYRWDFQDASTKDLSRIPAGTYAVTVTDSNNGVSVSETFVVAQPSAALSAGIEVTDTRCFGPGGSPTGAISITVTGGTAPYDINWSGDLPDNVTEQSGLSEGSYSFSITDANGCTYDSGTILVTRQSDVEVDLVPEQIGPQMPGAVSAVVSGASGPYQFSWRGPGTFTSQAQNISGLTVAGEYCLTVTDASGCTASECVQVYEVLRFSSVTIANACAGEDNGSIAVSLSGGLTPYTYEWSTGGPSLPTLDGLAPGIYGLTVTDAESNRLTNTFEVKQSPAIIIEAVVQPVTDREDNNNGSIQLSISGGRPDYVINWDNGATGTTLENLTAGRYCVSVTDQNACSSGSCFEVGFQTNPLSFSTQTEEPRCNGRTDGKLTISIQGGMAPYQVIFADGSKLNANNGQVTREGLPAGEVSFTIRDADDVEVKGKAVITEPEPIQIAEADVVHDTEAPGCTGKITLSLSGGTPGYSVLWNSPNTGPQIINLCEGGFIPTVSDSRGCTRTFEAISLNTFKMSGVVSRASCPATADGEINLNISGGTEPYSYRWVNDSGQELTGGASIKALTPGKYSVTVSEESGNNLVKEFVVGAVSNLSVSAVVLTDYNGYGVSCPDASDGRLRAQGANGAGGYSYEWTLGDEMIGTETVLSNARSGVVYEVTAIDNSGCSTSAEISIEAPPDIQVAENITSISCTGNTDGAIEVLASGGAGGDFFSYEWSNGISGPRISRLRAGIYTLTVTDAFDCQSVNSFELLEPKPLTVTVETEAATEGCNGRAQAVVSGGTAPYFYSWSPTQTDSVIADLCPGTYSVQVTDVRGCQPFDDGNSTSGLVADRRFACLEAIKVMTPNNDGKNELFLINCIEEFPDNHLEVYNRWGQLVFEAENYDNSWDGTDKSGNVLEEGAYFYVFAFRNATGNADQQKGAFTLLLE